MNGLKHRNAFKIINHIHDMILFRDQNVKGVSTWYIVSLDRLMVYKAETPEAAREMWNSFVNARERK